MINVSSVIKPQKVKNCHVRDLVRSNYSEHTNAFIGKCGFGPADSLYIVTYECVVLASNPGKSWVDGATVIVDRFVDLDIKIIGE